jgi:hypothetical protein
MAVVRNLTIRSEADGRTIPIQSIEDDVTISELADAYKAELGVPANREVSIRRKSTNKQLLLSDTIRGAGIQDNETLIATVAYQAGSSRNKVRLV